MTYEDGSVKSPATWKIDLSPISLTCTISPPPPSPCRMYPPPLLTSMVVLARDLQLGPRDLLAQVVLGRDLQLTPRPQDFLASTSTGQGPPEAA